MTINDGLTEYKSMLPPKIVAPLGMQKLVGKKKK